MRRQSLQPAALGLLLLVLPSLQIVTLAQTGSSSASSFTWSALCYESYVPLLSSSCAALQPGKEVPAAGSNNVTRLANLRQTLQDLLTYCLQDISSIDKVGYVRELAGDRIP
jgi:hypothetical protein